jgi:hypothetical protein
MHDQDEPRIGFRDRLLAAEPLSPAFRERLEQELHTMFVRELTTPRRIVLAVWALVALGSGLLCGWLSVTEPGLPAPARIGLGVGTLFGLAWAVVLWRISRRAAIDLRVDGRRIAAMVWGFTVLMMIFFLIASLSVDDRLLGILMVGNGLAFLVGAAVYWLTYRIEHTELMLRERLLELELRIAELAERR